MGLGISQTLENILVLQCTTPSALKFLSGIFWKNINRKRFYNIYLYRAGEKHTLNVIILFNKLLIPFL